METLSFCVGITGDIISVLLFLSPAGTFWRIVKQRSTEEFDSLPYICTLLSSSLWTYYGITRPGSYLVAAVNAFGVVVETVYVSLFLLFAPPKMRARTAILAGILDVGFLLAVILVTHLAMEGDTRIDAIGLLGAGLNVVMYGSPLAAMVPNGAGFILGIAQLLLYAVYQVQGSSSSSSSKPYSRRSSKTISSSSSSHHDDDHNHHAQPLLSSSSTTTDPIHIY
ncbi:bidirectional sugar transporter SWEET17-like [Diospyros lotus]|uniref:bidirectional sugar transporter SWEET17-like n=1 Tax=Diospyros lotus TaxID=55363 RepID=UPI00224D2C01|nr:bidirectional sugar transporter SWEET17-like [Diospyros lotus]